MRRSVIRALLLIAVSFSVANGAAATTATVQADPVEVLDIDVDGYSRQVGPGGSAGFAWTLRNVDPLNITFSVRTTVSALPTGWVANISNGAVLSLAYREAVTVALTLTAPGEQSGTANVTVQFQVSQGASPVQVSRRTALVGINAPVAAEKRVIGIFDNPLRQQGWPWSGEWGVFVLNILVWIGIAVVVYLVLDPCVKALTQRTKTKIDDIVLAIVKKPMFYIVFTAGAVNSLDAIDVHLNGLNPELIGWVHRAYWFILSVALFWIAFRLFKDIVLHYGKEIAKRTASKIDDILIPVVEKVGTLLIVLVFVGYLLGLLEIDLSLFVAGGVVVSMVIAFAAQDTLSNVFSGIFIMLDRPFEEGNQIFMEDGQMYEVRKVGLRTTRLFRYNDATIVTLPNNKLFGTKIANFSVEDKGRMMYKFGAAYGSDVKKVKEIIWDAIERCPNVVKDPRPILRFESMDDNAITFFVLVWVDERANRHSITDFLNTEIYDAFNRSGIEIPFPQRTVWIRYEDDQLRKIRGEPLGPRRATVPAVPAAPPVGPVVSGSRVGSKDTDQDQGD